MNFKKFLKFVLTLPKCLMGGVRYKRGLYIGVGAKIVSRNNVILGSDVSVMPYSMIVAHPSSKIEIGNGSTISMFSRIGSKGYIKLGEYVEMGPNVIILDYNHEYRDVTKPIKLQGVSFKKKVNETPNVEICDGAWIGAHVSIIGNVRIGKNSVIGANSVVTKDIPDYSVATGIPAKVIKRYNFETQKWEKLNN